jgi:protein gp37
MSDLFHEDVPDAYIFEAFSVMKEASWHTFQILTKRAKRLAELAPRLEWPANVWMGASVESPNFVWRIEELKTVLASVRFLSLEPLLAPIPNLPLAGIDWVIVGGESGPGCRPIEAAWVRNIRTQCVRARIPFFFKQWGGTRKSRAGRRLDGKVWNELPVLQNTPRSNSVSAD